MVAPHSTGHLYRSLVRVPNSGADRAAADVIFDLSRVSSLAATVSVSQTLPSALQHRLSLSDPENAKGQATSITAVRPCSRLNGGQSIRATASRPSPRDSASQTAPVTASRPRSVRGGQAAPATASSSKTATTKANTLPRCGKRTHLGESQQVNTTPAECDQPPTKKAKSLRKLPGQDDARASTAHVTLPQRNASSQPLSAGAAPAMLPVQSHLQPAVVMTLQQLLQELNLLRYKNQALKQQLSLFHILFRNKEKLTSIVRTLGIQVR